MTGMLVADDAGAQTGLDQPLVLMIADDVRVSSFLDRALDAAGYRVQRASEAAQALAAFELATPDLVLIDMAQPTSTALDVVRRLRARSGSPILMLAGGDGVDDRIAGLDAGADDYLAKPFAVEELLARVRALLRGRALAAAGALANVRLGTLVYADVRLDQDARQVSRGGRPLELRNKAFELLACFMRHPERVLSRRELLEEVWGFDFLGDSNVIEVTVSYVRQALEADGEQRLIHTVRPVGYILRASAPPPRC
jgi:two-component system, OmpR family, response regulator MprA